MSTATVVECGRWPWRFRNKLRSGRTWLNYKMNTMPSTWLATLFMLEGMFILFLLGIVMYVLSLWALLL